jgi:hypothetical protein
VLLALPALPLFARKGLLRIPEIMMILAAGTGILAILEDCSGKTLPGFGV